jgi:hypothetical protein
MEKIQTFQAQNQKNSFPAGKSKYHSHVIDPRNPKSTNQITLPLPI